MKFLNHLILALSFILAFTYTNVEAQIKNGEDESRMYAETKQVNQFFRRFNGEEDEKGERYYPKDKLYQDPQLRQNYLSMLFDTSNKNIKSDLKNQFVSYVTSKKGPVTLDFHGDDWFSQVTTTFHYKGRERTFILYMKLEKENLGHKWVIYKVYSDAFRDYMKKDASGKFLHPLSHELDFMNLRKALKDDGDATQFTIKDYRPDYLTLFLYEIKSGNLKFKTIQNVKFHFFQVDGWYFELSDFNRAGYNTGWLISDLIKVADKDKDLLRKYIYYEDQ